ncbi:MAG: hypothetical protein KVP17_000319 [Porospora cf. gigantea B]|uniref:uncharacterized protein n=1 Tax=Porospora cf. gigantea B TaxID=2853592 RepID=UPI003571E23D|nr:MAG: hypothetical protein KVP17_000319 [Porospora cf. gigantea B]
MKNLKNVRLQNDCFVSSGCHFDASVNEIRLGSHCIIGEDVEILPPGEDVIFGNYVTVYPRCDIRAKAVGDHVEIGAESKLGEGVVVSASAVIQPGSVVLPGTKVPTKCMFGGNPARYIVELPDAINGTIRLRNEKLLSRLR